jgi:hypothetical protein
LQSLTSPRVTPLEATSFREKSNPRSHPIPLPSRETVFSQSPPSPLKNGGDIQLDRRLEDLGSLMNATMGRLESLERLINRIQIDQEVHSMNFRMEWEEREKNRHRALLVSFHEVSSPSQGFIIISFPLVDHGNCYTTSSIHLLEFAS